MLLCEFDVQTTISHNALSHKQRVNICEGTVAAVQALHSSSFVHGNVTPSNILMQDGSPKLCGFRYVIRLHPVLYGACGQLNTSYGILGYQPSEVIRSRSVDMIVNLANAPAVDAFGRGSTMFSCCQTATGLSSTAAIGELALHT